MYVLVLLLVTSVSGLQYDGLKVTFGWSDALENKKYFFDIPRLLSQAEAEGWRRAERPPGPLPDLRLHCPPGNAVCPLYDSAGFIAGLQIALAAEDFESALRPDKRFVKWRAPPVQTEPAKDYWTVTQYFVSEESLKAGAGPQVENGATLQDGGVWVAGLDYRLLRIPSTEAELNSTTFKKQNCIPNMGTHYFYNMTSHMNCDNLLPWFALTTQGELVGTGFQIFGRLLKKQEYREWFEIIQSPKQSIQITIPNAPKCLYELAAPYGLISLHIYYIHDPWNIRCKTGDSIKAVPLLDRIMLNGHRYASKITDELKRMLGTG